MGSTTISGTEIPAATASDPALCRVSGYLKDLGNSALVGRPIYVKNILEPFGVGVTTAVLGGGLRVVSDADGYVVFDLPQAATVRVEFPGLATELFFEVTVPEASSVDLLDLLMPYLVSVVWDETDPLALDVDEVYALGATGTLSNGEEIAVGASMGITSDDSTTVLVREANYVVGMQTGTADVTITAVDTDLLGLVTRLDGEPIGRLDVPEATLPSALTVNVG